MCANVCVNCIVLACWSVNCDILLVHRYIVNVFQEVGDDK